MNCSGVVIKKSFLPHPLLRDLHSDIELMLTSCRKDTKDPGHKVGVTLVDLGEKKVLDGSDCLVNDSDTNLVVLSRTLEKCFR